MLKPASMLVRGSSEDDLLRPHVTSAQSNNEMRFMCWSGNRQIRRASSAVAFSLLLCAYGSGDVDPSSDLLNKWPEKGSSILISEIKHDAWNVACFLDPYDMPREAMRRYYPRANSFAMDDGDVALAENEFAIAYIGASNRSIDIDRYNTGRGLDSIYMVEGQRCVVRSSGNATIRSKTVGAETVNTLIIGGFSR